MALRSAWASRARLPSHGRRLAHGGASGPGLMMPSVEVLIRKYGLTTAELASIKGTGIHNSVVKGDVLAFVERTQRRPAPRKEVAKEASPKGAAAVDKAAGPKPVPWFMAPSEGHADIPNSNMRKVIAKRLTTSKQTVPHAYSSADLHADPLMKLRKLFLEKHNAKLSLNDFVIKAVASALRKVPQMNAIYDEKKGPVLMPTVDISIAVATEGGLITPIIKNADLKRVTEIAAELKDLAARARANKLKPDEFMGGSFTISNLGMFGVSEFSAVINPPQAAILAVGTTRTMMRVPKAGAPLPLAAPAPTAAAAAAAAAKARAPEKTVSAPAGAGKAPAAAASSGKVPAPTASRPAGSAPAAAKATPAAGAPAAAAAPAKSAPLLERVSMFNVTLSGDTRVVDDADATAFLAALRGVVEDPYTLLL